MDQQTFRSVGAWKKGLDLAGNSEYELKMFEAGHGIRQGGHGHTSGWPKFAPGYMETQLKWLEKNMAGDGKF